MRHFALVTVALLLIASPSIAEDTEEVAELKARIKELETKLEKARDKNDMLEEELRQAKAGEKPAPAVAKNAAAPRLSDLLQPGTVITGTYKFTKNGRKNGTGDIRVKINKRNGNQFEGTATGSNHKDGNKPRPDIEWPDWEIEGAFDKTEDGINFNTVNENKKFGTVLTVC